MDRRDDFDQQRETMVQRQLAARDIQDPRVLSAVRAVPRHRFVPPAEQRYAYEDRPLRIGSGQTISQPYIVALMTQLLELKGEERVLEIGTGSGYQAALLAHLAAEVHSVERHASLAEGAAAVLADLGLDNIYVHVGDGSLGWPAAAPYDAIIATASAPRAPQALLDQLADGGRLVLPVGAGMRQVLQRWRRAGAEVSHENVVPVAFVPLIGEQGWSGS